MRKKKKIEESDDIIEPDLIPIIEEEEETSHYVDNKEFLAEMIKWKKRYNAAEESGRKKPPISNYIAEAFLKIAEHLSYRPNFMNYPYREEMVGDGVENCLMYAHNFDPNKSKNPFSYFTQIIYFAFLRRIEKEKKQSYIKYKIMEDNADEKFHRWFKENYFAKDSSASFREIFSLSENDVNKFEDTKVKKKKKKIKNRK
jgi:hypothetical protein